MNEIPFDIEKFNAGLKPVYRNGEIPKRVILTPEGHEKAKIISFDKDGIANLHFITGEYFTSSQSPFDLFLIPEEETLWIAVRKENTTEREGTYTVSSFTSQSELELIKKGYSEERYDFISFTRKKH